MSNPKFSIIICLYIPNKRFYEDLHKYSNLNYKDFELILATEKNFESVNLDNYKLPIRVVKSDKDRISLGEKRDLGIKASKGEFCAFIDDDAYPDEDWLSGALKVFNGSKKIGAVGGPNLTPSEDNFFAKVGGYIYESYLTSGEAQYRFLPRKRRNVTELQGVNLIIRKDVLDEIGGFRSKLYSGDDSKVCNNILTAGYEIVYDPGIKVYHHRREFPSSHLKQIRNMGTHRGFFVKAYPKTLSPIYFLPSVLCAGFFIGLVLSLYMKDLRAYFLSLFILFFIAGMMSVIKRAGIIKSFFVSAGIILTHITYGIFFVRGLFLKTIERQG